MVLLKQLDTTAVDRAADVLIALLRHGHDQPGDLVLGEAALQAALQASVSDDDLLAPDDEHGIPAPLWDRLRARFAD